MRTVKEISKELNISRQAIDKRMRVLGIRPKWFGNVRVIDKHDEDKIVKFNR